jgi:general secretion pathway protein G
MLLTRRPSSQGRGFTLIELLIVVAIIGVIAAVLIPNLIDSLQKAKQRRTVNDVRAVGSAWFSWVTDQLGAAAAGSSSQTFDITLLDVAVDSTDLTKMLRRADMNYIATIPEKDGWGGDYDYFWAGDASVTPTFGLRSKGRDRAEGPTTNPYPLGSFATTAYDEDIVWVDGNFIRFPSGTQIN